MSIPIRSAALRLLAATALTSSFVFTTAPAHATPGACHPHGRDLSVTFQPIDHTVTDAQYYLARLTLANGGGRCSLAGGWTLYFNSVRQPAAVLSGAAGDTARAQLASQGLAVARADRAQSGDLYALTPTSAFAPLKPGERRKIDMNFELWAIQKTDAPAGWSISFGGGTAEWVPAKALLDPADPKQTKAFSGDNRPVQTAATRYADDTAQKANLSLQQRLVPQPLSATAGQGTVTITGRTAIRHSAGLSGEAGYLRSALGDVVKGGGGRGDGGGTVIRLSVDPKLDVDNDGKADAEGYTLRATAHGVDIVGKDAAGVLYGVQTLRQLIPVSAYAAAARGARPSQIAVPQATISDAPLFGYRGMGIDVARHFETRQTIEKFLDLMSYLKLNRLHFHLTDDEGWRLQIPGLPELTDFGAHRGLDLGRNTQLHQAMGSGNDLGGGDGVTDKARDATEANLGHRPAYQGFEQDTVNFVGKGSGYYTTADFVDILKYANRRHIQVVPEFDFPAHARAAVQSMEHRYQRTGDATYRLLDPKDTSNHVSVQGYTDNLANPCLPSTYAFLGKVATEVKKLYARAGAPLNTFNLGGDEPPGPNRWQGSPACKSNPETAGKDDAALMNYFFTKWNRIALTVAPTTAGWEDVVRDDPRTLNLDHFIALPWQNVWGWGREDWAYHFANTGRQVILAHATNLYMDLAYNKDPDEPGYYWANYVDEKSTFTYQPYDVYASATEDRWGNPIQPSPSWEKLTPEGRKNILGMEAQLFAENGKSEGLREYQAFPKLLGVAERAWNRHTPDTAQMPAAWDVFSNTLGQVTFPLLSFYKPVGLPGVGVNYRIPLPGGQVRDGTLTANVRNPGMAIEYSTDGVSWRPYGGPVKAGPTVLLRTRAVDGRTSRISPVGLTVWQTGTAYPAGALVDHQGEIYRAKRANTSAAPDTSPSSWALVR
ncbi:family 20 glycosylhydrolase [Actinoallomurus rhizosphaericola]|uniref:family 20 glycosylhydrolase n=1 Tax=Actinoallomurus rhizosphaericola TaxID=2952536 RepID=UPI002092E574|nr:family 20 glycosylhydrolase [Actinoallomurus rhizosphaericola]MCO5995450.1 carbohydate-binding domain-containing protein [Actinoallomurus rhizosphaericola]